MAAAGRPHFARIEVPAGVPGRTVNVYVVPGRVPTLIDAGPALPGTAGRVAAAAESAGVPLGAVAQIVVTHGHPGHAGALAALQAASGAPILAHPRAVAALTNPEAAHAARAAFLARAAEAAGAPPAVIDRIAPSGAAAGELPAAVDAGALRALAPGAVIAAGDAAWSVLHVPGHAPDHLALHHHGSGMLFTGDLVLRHRSTLPALEPRTADGRPRTLDDLIASLLALGRIDASILLPGHGAPIRAHRVLVARRLADIRASLGAVRSVVAARPRSLWDVACHLGGPVDDAGDASARLALAVACADWLVESGWADRHIRNGVVFLERRAGAGRGR